MLTNRDTIPVDTFDYEPKNNNSNMVISVNKIDPNLGLINIDLDLTLEAKQNIKEEKLELVINSSLISIQNGHYIYPYHVHNNSFEVILDEPILNNSYSNKSELVYQKKDLDIKIIEDRPGIFFPFDRYHVPINIFIKNSNGDTIEPKTWVLNKDAQFVNSSPVNPVAYSDELEESWIVPSSVLMEFKRPTYQIFSALLFWIISFSIVAWSMVKIFSSKAEDKHFEILGLNITLILTLPSFREIIVPSNLQTSAIFDFSTVLIWLAALVTIGAYIYKDKKRLFQK